MLRFAGDIKLFKVENMKVEEQQSNNYRGVAGMILIVISMFIFIPTISGSNMKKSQEYMKQGEALKAFAMPLAPVIPLLIGVYLIVPVMRKQRIERYANKTLCFKNPYCLARVEYNENGYMASELLVRIRNNKVIEFCHTKKVEDRSQRTDYTRESEISIEQFKHELTKLDLSDFQDQDEVWALIGSVSE